MITAMAVEKRKRKNASSSGESLNSPGFVTASSSSAKVTSMLSPGTNDGMSGKPGSDANDSPPKKNSQTEFAKPKTPPSDEEKAEKKRLKKENQKQKKLAKKMAVEKKESNLLIVGDGTIATDTFNYASSSRSASSVSARSVQRDQAHISLIRSPMKTFLYFLREVPCLLQDSKNRLSISLFGDDSTESRSASDLFGILILSSLVGFLLVATYLWTIGQDPMSLRVKENTKWYSYWIFLGILSSVGFGTGLHTFVLYLGPFIAKVTLAAEECSTLDFPRPPYPHQILCPSEDVLMGPDSDPSVWRIMSKVRWESIAWGFGTALGELPPYFVAKAARLSGTEDGLGTTCCIQRCMKNFVMKIGFFGILLCASIPNPLFDFAGLTCGHFLVPFLTFFGATVIGKTMIKAQVQAVVVIMAFKESWLQSILNFVRDIPFMGHSLGKALAEFMDYQKSTIHDKKVSKSGGILKTAADTLFVALVVYFIISIINGMAKSFQRRLELENAKPIKTKSKQRKTRKWLMEHSSTQTNSL